MDLKIVLKNINNLTNKEKVAFIETLLGVSVTMSQFLIRMQEIVPFPFPAEIHYMILISMTNINSLSNDEGVGDIIDYSLKIDDYECKLIAILKQLNEIYKDELNDFISGDIF